MELIRLLKSKKFLAFFVALLVLNGALFFVVQQRAVQDMGVRLGDYRAAVQENVFSLSDSTVLAENEKYSRLLSFMQLDEDAAGADSPELQSFFAEQQAALAAEDPSLYRAYTNGKYDSTTVYALSFFYGDHAAQAEHRAGYPAYIDEILSRGEDLADFRLFAGNAYSSRSLQKTVAAFASNHDLALTPVNDRPIMAVMTDQTGDFILLLIGLFTVLAFTGTGKSFTELLSTGKSGRAVLTLRRLPLLFGCVLFGAIGVYGVQLLIGRFVYVLPLDLSAPVQSSSLFADCIYKLNFGQFLVLFVLFKALACTALSLIFWLLSVCVQSVALPAAVFGGVVAVEFALYQNISAQSTLSFFKNFNLFALFDDTSIVRYRLFSLFGSPQRTDVWTLVVLVFLCLLAAALLLVRTASARPVRSPGRGMQALSSVAGRFGRVWAALQSRLYAGRFESYKVLHIGKGLLVFLVLFAVLYAGFSTNVLAFSPAEEYLNTFYAEHGGAVTDATFDAVEELRASLAAVDAEFEAVQSAYASGTATAEELFSARQKYELFAPRRDALQTLDTQLAHLQQVKERGEAPVLLNEKGYSALFDASAGQQEILLALCAVILLSTCLFPIEKTSGMYALNHCAAQGRGRVFVKKMCTLLPSAFVACVAVYGVQIGQIAYLYGLPGLSAGVQNLQCLTDLPLAVPIWGYLALIVAFAFFCTLCTGLICAAASQFIAQTAAAVCGLFLFVLPSLLYILGLYAVQGVAAVYTFNLNALLLDGAASVASRFWPAGVLLAGAVVFTTLAARSWCMAKEK